MSSRISAQLMLLTSSLRGTGLAGPSVATAARVQAAFAARLSHAIDVGQLERRWARRRLGEELPLQLQLGRRGAHVLGRGEGEEGRGGPTYVKRIELNPEDAEMLRPAAATTNASGKEGRWGRRDRKMCERGPLCHHDIILKSVCDGRQAGRRAARRARARRSARGSLMGGTSADDERLLTRRTCRRVAPFCTKGEKAAKLVKKVCLFRCCHGGRSHAAGFHAGRACSQGCSCCSRLWARSRKAT